MLSTTDNCSLLHEFTQVRVTKAYPIVPSVCTFCHFQETSNCQRTLIKIQHLKIQNIWTTT